MIDIFIQDHAKVLKLDCKIDSEIQLYIGKIGVITGLKKLKTGSEIYLIEFFDYNRIWATKQELVKFTNN